MSRMTSEELDRLPWALLDRLVHTATTTMFEERDLLDADPNNEEFRRRYLQARDWMIACQDARRKPRPAILRIKIDRVFDEDYHMKNGTLL